MSKFTKGPWYANQLTPHKQIKESICITSNEGPITFMSTTSSNYIDTLWANARLIAAAPELYEALEMATKMLQAANCTAAVLNPLEKVLNKLERKE